LYDEASVSFRKNFISLLSWSSLSQALSILSLPLISFFFFPHDFGVLAAFISIGALLEAFCSLRLEWQIPNSSNLKEALITALLALIAAFFLLCLIWPVLLLLPFRIGDLSPEIYRQIILLALVNTFVVTFKNTLSTLFVYHGNLSRVAQSNMLQSLVNMLLSLLLGYLGGSYLSLIWSYMLANLLAALYLFVCTQTEYKQTFQSIRIHDLKATWHILLPKTAVSTSVSVFNSLSYNIIPLLIVSFFGSHIAGLYFMGQKLINAPVGLISHAMSLSFWSEAAKLVKHDPVALRHKYQRLTLKLMYPAFALSICIYLGSFVLPVILGSKWDGISAIVIAFVPMVFGRLVFSSLGHLIVLNKHHYQLYADIFRTILVSLVIVLSAQFVMLPVYMIFFVASSSLLGHLIFYRLHLKAYQVMIGVH